MRMMFYPNVLFVVCLAVCFKADAQTLEPSDIIIVVLSQKEGYHAAHADISRKGILEQANTLDKDPPVIILTHELDINGTWTIIPLLKHLPAIHEKAKWIFFCLENTVIRLNKLLNLLSKYKSNKNVWIGHALYDHEPTIIHHFAEHNKKFKYPHVASGFAISSGLLHSLLQLNEDKEQDDFAIDASYEFASFVAKLNKSVRLTHVSEICIVSSSDCATYPRFFHPCATSVSPENVYFAVKTCAKYHVERIPTIKNTWAKYATNVGYFSDAAV